MNQAKIDGGVRRTRAAALSALAVLWLSACGGGGGGGDAAPAPGDASQVAAPGPAPAPGSAPAPTPAPAPAECAAPNSGNVTGTELQAAANGEYTVTSSEAGVVITLPANECLQPGDRVRVSGQSAAAWRLAQNPLQWVDTAGLPGNLTPGTAWTPRTVDPAMPRQNWVASASSADGNRIAVVSNPGSIYLSQDGGASWTRAAAPAADWSWIAMNEEGSHLAAVASDTAIHVSTDYGRTWTATGSPALPWNGVHLSEDGRRIFATAYGAVYRSLDGGATFAPVASLAGGDWRAVSGSRDGERLVAVASFFSESPTLQGVYVSTDAGVTWTRRVGNGNWSFAASSADGRRMAAIDNGNNPWVSDDGGVSWTMRFSYSNWSGLAVSGNGQVISALEPRDDTRNYTGYTFVSPDGGQTWNWYGENRWYRASSLSFDGNWMVVGDTGPNGSGGLVYTSQGNRTARGALGSISGGAGQVLELTYQGNGRFNVSGHAGGAFTIR